MQDSGHGWGVCCVRRDGQVHAWDGQVYYGTAESAGHDFGYRPQRPWHHVVGSDRRHRLNIEGNEDAGRI